MRASKRQVVTLLVMYTVKLNSAANSYYEEKTPTGVVGLLSSSEHVAPRLKFQIELHPQPGHLDASRLHDEPDTYRAVESLPFKSRGSCSAYC